MQEYVIFASGSYVYIEGPDEVVIKALTSTASFKGKAGSVRLQSKGKKGGACLSLHLAGCRVHTLRMFQSFGAARRSKQHVKAPSNSGARKNMKFGESMLTHQILSKRSGDDAE